VGIAMIFTILSVIETLIVNLVHTDVIAKRKYSIWLTLIVIICYSALLAGFIYIAGMKTETSVRVILVGSTFIIPLYFIYKIGFKELVIVMTYCWSYTLQTNSIAYGIVQYFHMTNPTMYIFIIETILILSTIFFLIKFTRKRFLLILGKSNRNNQNILIVLGFAIFFAIVGIRFYVSPDKLIYFFLFFSVMVIGWSSYTLMYAIVQSNLSLTDANKIAFKDSLTGIKNRYSLFKELNTLIRGQKPFLLLFMDLDDLKSVNDTYDHSAGDQYLRLFANITTDYVKTIGEMYRFAGDEFVSIISKSPEEFSMADFEAHIKQQMSRTFTYNGVSIGSALYPKDGLNADEIISCADKAMYGDKRSKKIRR